MELYFIISSWIQECFARPGIEQYFPSPNSSDAGCANIIQTQVIFGEILY